MSIILKNMVVAISGAAGRLGSCFAKEIVSHGGKVILADISKDKCENLLRELGNENADIFIGDITEAQIVDGIIEHGKNKFGKIDAAVHSAYPVSKQWGKTFEDLEPANLKEDLFMQLGSAIIFSQRMIRHFLDNGQGNLIHISSIQSVSAPKFEHYKGTDIVSPIEYSAIKSGINMVTRYLAKYYKGKNIRVNSISPGGIFNNQNQIFVEKYREDCLTKGLLDPLDISGTLIYLLSDYSKYVNGQNIVVDDGWSL